MCIWTTVLDKDPKVNIVEKGQPFKQMVLQQLDITLKKKNLDAYLKVYTKMNIK